MIAGRGADDCRPLQIPATIKRDLNLDADRSWIVLEEWNEFVWPGPDLRPVPNDDVGSIAHGVLSRGFFARVRDEFLAAVEAGRSKRVPVNFSMTSIARRNQVRSRSRVNSLGCSCR